ncbi:NAD-dependent epimerase/dehydratase family protein [Flavicella sp.]|uniref:NAD-dependent epimerase/dehydratase family protein n=1 Tax=Flavicella sp. TaxID=2957742 RepID=UPI002620994C|nr:NAD-dependent epimerase/dehydratase family protein [Flavicella sp.]MDG1805229.1 NAD-dependent epimerase/dehydratase family protein [Flavicella sp.]
MILVTGGTGMVGAHLLLRLTQSGHSVRAIYRSEKSLEKTRKVFSYVGKDADLLFSKIDWVAANITDIPSLESAFEGVEKVYHIAALVSFDERLAKQMRSVNIDGTANVVNLSIAHGVSKFCFVSSIASIAKSVEKSFIDEEDDFNLMTNNYSYAITKYGAEMEVWRGAQEGLKVLIVNPGVILGTGFWKENSGLLFSMIDKGTPFYTEGVTGFVGVNDVVSVMVKGMESDISNERFILVSENIGFKEVFHQIADALQKKKPRVKLNVILAEIGWRLSLVKSIITGKTNSFTRHAAKSANNKSYYNSEKVQKMLSFEFQSIAKVIEETADQYKKDTI